MIYLHDVLLMCCLIYLKFCQIWKMNLIHIHCRFMVVSINRTKVPCNVLNLLFEGALDGLV